ncbi:MAG: hypothetical protein PHY43_06185 [Verrucomicrobiales bacterium]|nr:hypothetical protein [Verrucomicrobiales bacterium]
MRLNWNLLRLAMLAAFGLFAAGCSGINASHSVSPLDFFLPGMGSFLKADPSATNAPVSFREISTEVASVK